MEDEEAKKKSDDRTEDGQNRKEKNSRYVSDIYRINKNKTSIPRRIHGRREDDSDALP